MKKEESYKSLNIHVALLQPTNYRSMVELCMMSSHLKMNPS